MNWYENVLDELQREVSVTNKANDMRRLADKIEDSGDDYKLALLVSKVANMFALYVSTKHTRRFPNGKPDYIPETYQEWVVLQKKYNEALVTYCKERIESKKPRIVETLTFAKRG